MARNITTNFLIQDNLTDWELVTLPFVASTAIDQGTAIGIEISSNTTTGYVTKMGTENASGADFVGILQETIAATDDDYATAGKMKSVAIPKSPNARARFSVGAGTLTSVDRFKTVEFHSDSKSLAVDTAGKGARIVEVFADGTGGYCTFPFGATETA